MKNFVFMYDIETLDLFFIAISCRSINFLTMDRSLLHLLESKVEILIERNPMKTSFKEWVKLDYFLGTITKCLHLSLRSRTHMLYYL